MRKRWLVPAVLPFVVMSFAADSASAQAAVPPLAGEWQLDVERSDDAERKIEEAMNAPTSNAMTSTTSRGTTISSRARPVDARGAASAGGAGGSRPAGRPSGAQAALLDTGNLVIEFGDGTVIFGVGNQNVVILQPGIPTTMTRWGIAGVEVRTQLRDNRLDIDTRGPGNLRVQERYELKRNGEIEAQYTVNLPGVAGQIRMKRFYTAPEN